MPFHHDSLKIKPSDLKEYSRDQSTHAHLPTVSLRMVFLFVSTLGFSEDGSTAKPYVEHLQGLLRTYCLSSLSILIKAGSLLNKQQADDIKNNWP